jgi:hypothetical protein
MTMRIGVTLVLGMGVLFAAACNGPSPDEPACFAAGGLCVATDAGGGVCVSNQTGGCPTNYFCCVPTGPPGADSGSRDAISSDSGQPLADAAKDGTPKDAVPSADAAKPGDGGKADAAKD